MNLLRPEAEDEILEVGIADEEYSSVDNFLIKQYPHRDHIVALGVGSLDRFRAAYPEVRTVSYDGVRFPFKDRSFAVVHANAVIEHVGPLRMQCDFLREMARVSRRGMLTTPNKLFPIETHTKIPLFHWMKKEWFDRILRLVGKMWASGDYMFLLDKKHLEMIVEGAGLNHYEIIENKFLCMTMTFTLIWYGNTYEGRMI